MSESLTCKITRDDVSPALAKLAATARNPEKIYRSMGTTFESVVLGMFNRVGEKYRPIAWVAKKDGQPSTLRKFNTLSRSFFLRVTSTSATLGTPVVYAATHQFGRTEGRGAPIPARPFFPVVGDHLTPEVENLIRRAGERALARETGAESSGDA